MTDFRRALTPALWAALWAFLGPVLVLALGVLQDVAEWASTSGKAPLPGLSTLGYAFVAALCSAAAGLVAFVFRYAQTKGVLGGDPPTYDGKPLGEDGAVNWTVVCLVVIACVAVMFAIGWLPIELDHN